MRASCAGSPGPRAHDPLDRARADPDAPKQIDGELGEADAVRASGREDVGGILGRRPVGVVADARGEGDEDAGHGLRLPAGCRPAACAANASRSGACGSEASPSRAPVGKGAGSASGESLTRTRSSTDPPAAAATDSE